MAVLSLAWRPSKSDSERGLNPPGRAAPPGQHSWQCSTSSRDRDWQGPSCRANHVEDSDGGAPRRCPAAVVALPVSRTKNQANIQPIASYYTHFQVTVTPPLFPSHPEPSRNPGWAAASMVASPCKKTRRTFSVIFL
jgi:hypothetical protein